MSDDKNGHLAKPYTAVYLLFRREGKLAFVLRANTGWMDGYYGLPAGRVEQGESLAAAAVREAKEEAGVDLSPDDLELVLTAHRNDPDSLWVDAMFEVKDWQGEIHNAEPEVHSELAWLDPDFLPENILPYTKHYLEQLAAGHNYAELGWN